MRYQSPQQLVEAPCPGSQETPRQWVFESSPGRTASPTIRAGVRGFRPHADHTNRRELRSCPPAALGCLCGATGPTGRCPLGPGCTWGPRVPRCPWEPCGSRPHPTPTCCPGRLKPRFSQPRHHLAEWLHVFELRLPPLQSVATHTCRPCYCWGSVRLTDASLL